MASVQGPWTPEEDTRLAEIVAAENNALWAAARVAAVELDRSVDSCVKRINDLRHAGTIPWEHRNRSAGFWTEEDDARLIAIAAEQGYSREKTKTVAAREMERSRNAIYERYGALQRDGRLPPSRSPKAVPRGSGGGEDRRRALEMPFTEKPRRR